MKIKSKIFRKALTVAAAAAFSMSGCAVDPSGGTSGTGPDNNLCQDAKCDSGAVVNPYTWDKEAMNTMWGSANPNVDGKTRTIEQITDAFSVFVQLGQGIPSYQAPTHLFGVPVNVIPYCDADNCEAADGSVLERGDEVIAKYFEKGEIGYCIKNHRHEHRLLKMGEGADPSSMKEDMKLQDTHIEIVAGVTRNGKPGAITFNNPQSYPGGEAGPGRFGDTHYPMIFVKPVYPDYIVEKGLKGAFQDNIRTMLMGFNAVSEFPGDYNGGDALAARNVEKVQEHVAMMVRRIADDSDQAAAKYFADDENMIYCAELAHVSSSAGLIVPLNEDNVVPLVASTLATEKVASPEDVSDEEAAAIMQESLVKARELWATFQGEIDKHNAYRQDRSLPESRFTKLNRNPAVDYIELAKAPADLMPAAMYAPEDEWETEGQKLAFQKMTMADIVQHFMRTHFPRDLLGEQMGSQLQAMVLSAMKPGLMATMDLDKVFVGEGTPSSWNPDPEDYVDVPDITPEEYPVVESELKSNMMSAEMCKQQPELMGDFCADQAAMKELKNKIKVDNATLMRFAVNMFWDTELVPVVATPHASYAEFEAALAPVMQKARMMTGPRGDSGSNLFVPPSMFHIIAQGKNPGGLLKLQYVGHGVHVSATRKKTGDELVQTETYVEDGSPYAYSCRMYCGEYVQAPQTRAMKEQGYKACYCDPVCVLYPDEDKPCCQDFAAQCGESYPWLAEKWDPAYARTAPVVQWGGEQSVEE